MSVVVYPRYVQRNRYVCLAFLMALVSILLPKSTATPANRQYYVAVTGSDSNDGSSAHPWKTIQHAADLALPGWTIRILAGTYSISTTVTTSNSGTPGSPITFVGDMYSNANRRWFTNIVYNGTHNTVWQINGAYVTIRGIGLSSNYPGSENGIKSSAPYTVVENSHIHHIAYDGGGGCVVGGSGADHMSVLNNELANCGSSLGNAAGKHQHGIYLHGYYSIVQNNLIYNVSGTGVHLYSYGSGHPNQEPWHSIISNNTIFRCSHGITAMADRNGFADYNEIRNNIIAFIVSGDTAGRGIYQSSLDPARTYGTHNIIDHNLIWCTSCDRYSGLSGTNDINANPQFINYQADGTGDYHLRSTSPAVKGGTSTNASKTDFDGISRHQGSGCNIGAYEGH